MTTTDNAKLPAEEEAITTITLPPTALETLAATLGVQLGSGHSALEGSTLLAATTGRGEPLPCFKKSAWGERLIINITQEHAIPGAA